MAFHPAPLNSRAHDRSDFMQATGGIGDVGSTVNIINAHHPNNLDANTGKRKHSALKHRYFDCT